jgi:dCTP deaminase
MTLLHYEELRRVLNDPDLAKRLVVVPLLDDRQVGPAAIDLRLGTDFLFLRRTERAGMDPKEGRTALQSIHERLKVPLGKPLWLHPGQFLLGSTLEFVRMPADLAALLIGRSSWARLGLVVEMAGLVQPGYAGTLTYELVNMGDSPIALYPGLRVAQLAVYRLPGPTEHATLSTSEKYPAKYLAAVGPEASRVAWEDDELTKVLAVGAALYKGELGG